MSKLRTEYVKSLGVELSRLDCFDYSKKFIKRFAKRKNQLKVQPVGNDVHVFCYPGPSSKAKDINWADVTLWAPSYSKLLEMQAVHDEKNASDEVEVKELTLIDLRSTKWDLSEQSEVERRAWQEAFFKLGGRWFGGDNFAECLSVRLYFIDKLGRLRLAGINDVFQEMSFKQMHFNDLVHADVNQVKTPLVTVKKDNLVYTQEMHKRGVSPVVGMLVKCVFGIGVLKYIGHYNCIVNYDGDDKFCVAERLGYIDNRTLEQKQLDEVANIILDFPSDDYQALAELLRDKGLLAEIVKPLA